jgi:5-methylcytosine-specific restriction endonuclease McrA
MPSNKTQPDTGKLDRIVAEARRSRELREQDYREQALKIYPWICGRCSRTFTRVNVQQLTVHHKDHNHDNNPPDGSNWELLCVYCHDNEHARYLDSAGRGEAARGSKQDAPSTYKAFADLKARLKGKGDAA